MRGENSTDRFGSSRRAEYADLQRARLFKQTPQSLFMGYFEGEPVHFHGPAGAVMIAGARAGKMRDVIARNLLSGNAQQSILMLDPKGEGAYLSQNQTADGKCTSIWAPAGAHGLPTDSINFLGHITIDGPTLVSDIKVLWENLIAPGRTDNAAYFTGRAREYGEAISLATTELEGSLSFPRLYEAITLLPTNNDQWQDIAFHMSRSAFPQVQRVEAEIAASRDDSSGGFRGIMGELLRAVACLSDPMLMASVSPPYTMRMEDIVADDQAWQMHLCPPAEFISAWSPIIKSAFVSAMLLKSRAPSAPGIAFLLDECGQLAGESGFPLVGRLFTYGAGTGIQPFAVFQSKNQMRALGPEAESLIMSSAATKLMFALRDYDSASEAACMCGSQTLEYDDRLAQERAVHARNSAINSVLGGGDILQAGLSLAHQNYAAEHQSKQHRQVMQPDEVMNMAPNEALFFHEDVPYPIILERRPYWSERSLAGAFHPNPYHPPLDKVTVQTFWGKRTRRVITEPVPAKYAHYPQYRTGTWSRVER